MPQPLAIAVHPRTGIPTWFVIAPDHTVAWKSLQPWASLGGWLRAIDAYWTPDGQTLHLVGVGQDSRLWFRAYDFDTGWDAGWGYPTGIGQDLHSQAVISDP